MSSVTVLHGDSREVLKTLPDASIDACVTDAPYALLSIHKRFANSQRTEATEGSAAGPYQRTGRGFMGQRWDTGEVAHDSHFWREVHRVLKPGGHVVAFSGTRTQHRQVCAIEDAGFEIRDQIGWAFGSGFPKSHNQKGEWEGWGTALKPAWEPICLARKPLIGSVAANLAEHGVGALNIDGCRIATDEALQGSTVRSDIRGGAFAAGHRPNPGDITPYAQNARGRWPANIVHDGSAEVITAFPDAPGQSGAVTGAEPSTDLRHGRSGLGGLGGDHGTRVPRGDSGSAARFFYAVEPDDLCGLCDCPLGLSNAKLSPCNVSTAASSSQTENTPIGATAASVAPGSLPPESAGKTPASSDPAPAAGSCSSLHRQTGSDTAGEPAQTLELSSLVQNVRSAAHLCASCATDIAQRLAEVRRSGKPDPSPFRCSIDGFRRTILSRSLVRYVEGRESTDTILTTESLRELFGSVFHAIAENTNSARSEANTKSAPKRLWYSAKADAEDRLGSKHPTVKPVDLMAWLCRLVTPPGGVILDPFAGTGTTGVAALREGFDCILIEREEQYVADIHRRLAWARGEGRLTAQEMARGEPKPVEGLPLFGGEAA